MSFESDYQDAGPIVRDLAHRALLDGVTVDSGRVGRAVAVELLGRGLTGRESACLAGYAIAELASARAAIREMAKKGVPSGRRYPTRDDRDAIAEEAAAKRRADA